MLIADIDGAKFISHCDLEMTQYLPGFYTKSNPRKGFTPVLSDWIKGLVLIFGVTQR